ncbi:hypothetical protein EYC80_007035 [Monilinia laxa]|uniref:Uncharacterized protein n=1 Tax=Monilinia laxa TaxID=61186 RepID=A0A5N6K0B8_MONLA|nr:hypothetical protein EYC80_007035 [Monilinia laxa]
MIWNPDRKYIQSMTSKTSKALPIQYSCKAIQIPHQENTWYSKPSPFNPRYPSNTMRMHLPSCKTSKPKSKCR